MSALQDNAEYMILNANGRSLVDLYQGNKANNTKVVGWSPHLQSNFDNQIWKVKFTEKDGSGNQWCTLTNRQSGTALDLENGTAANGTQVQGYQPTGSNIQQWMIWLVRNRSSPLYVYAMENSRKCMASTDL